MNRLVAAVCTSAAVLCLVATPQSAIPNPQSAIPNAQSAGAGWRALFDGTSLDAWRGYKNDRVPTGWRITDRALAKDASVGDLISKDEFGDFDLELEWKI